MRIEFDPEDDRENYGELRMIGFAPIGRVVYFVAFTESDDRKL